MERSENWRRLWDWSFCPSLCVSVCLCTRIGGNNALSPVTLVLCSIKCRRQLAGRQTCDAKPMTQRTIGLVTQRQPLERSLGLQCVRSARSSRWRSFYNRRHRLTGWLAGFFKHIAYALSCSETKLPRASFCP